MHRSKGSWFPYIQSWTQQGLRSGQLILCIIVRASGSQTLEARHDRDSARLCCERGDAEPELGFTHATAHSAADEWNPCSGLAGRTLRQPGAISNVAFHAFRQPRAISSVALHGWWPTRLHHTECLMWRSELIGDAIETGIISR